jgi:hypothetical protein
MMHSEFDAIRALESNNICFLAFAMVRTILSQPDHNLRVSKVTTLPYTCVRYTTIGPRRDSRPYDRPLPGRSSP